MTEFDAALALTVASSTGFGAMLGYGWLYPRYHEAVRAYTVWRGDAKAYIKLLADEQTDLLHAKAELDIMLYLRARDMRKRSAAAKVARAAQLAHRPEQLSAERDRVMDVAKALPVQPLRPRDEVVAEVRARRAARRAGLLL